MPQGKPWKSGDEEMHTVTYLSVAPKDAAKAKKILEDALKGEMHTVGDGKGGTTQIFAEGKGKDLMIEEHHARIDDTFEHTDPALHGKKFVFLCTSDDSTFHLGSHEIGILKDNGISAGRFRDSDNIVQNALEEGRSRKQAGN